MLKQGFGRLIRSKDDYGVVAILDSRITKKGYGKKFVQALPEARVTSDTSEIGRFFVEKQGIKQ
jgi:ATP-dependent DNA helicase DinG